MTQLKQKKDLFSVSGSSTSLLSHSITMFPVIYTIFLYEISTCLMQLSLLSHLAHISFPFLSHLQYACSLTRHTWLVLIPINPLGKTSPHEM